MTPLTFKFSRESQDDHTQREYHLFFVPTRSLLCEKRLEVSLLYNVYILLTKTTNQV